MADLLSVLQANNQPVRGWGSVGQALAGLSGAGREDAYNRGMARAAQLDQLVQTARFSREKAMEAEDARRGRGAFAQSAAAAGIPVAQATLLSDAFAAGYDPTKLSGYVGQNQEQDFRQNIVAQALAGNLPAAGAYSMGLAKGPLEMTKITDGTGYNPYLQADQQYHTTPVGQATIGQRNASAAASYASASKSNASAARTRQAMGIDGAQFALQRAGQWNPGGKPDNPVAVGRPLGAPTINKLAGDAEKLETLQVLQQSFQDKFAGNKTGGDLENLVGRLGLPGATPGQSDWWQRYDRQKNVVRNELFGAALTANEQAEFDKADINPNMAPATVKKNLATQAGVIERALKRQARTWAAQGYNTDALREATGLSDFADSDPAAQPTSPAGWGIRKVK